MKPVAVYTTNLPRKQLLRFKLCSFPVGRLSLFGLLQLTRCNSNKHPGIVVILLKLQNSL